MSFPLLSMGRNSYVPPKDVATVEQRPEIICSDRFLDESYVGPAGSSAGYRTTPWEHYKDPVASYLSLRFSQKEIFLERLEETPKQQVKREIDRIEDDRSRCLGKSNKQRLEIELQNSYREWRKTVSSPSELRQIASDREKQVKKLVGVHKKKLREWDTAHFKELKQLADDTSQSEQQTRPSHEVDDPYPGFRAGAMYFRKRKDGSLKGFTSENSGYQKDIEFPDQKISLKDLLDDADDSPLSKDQPDDEVRYFHFPSNNMEWIENAINQYYSRRRIPSKDCERLLSREHWTGQMHGGEPVDGAFREVTNDAQRTAPVHSRHMRSKCLLIPRDHPQSLQTSQSTNHDPPTPGEIGRRSESINLSQAGKNVAIFMPYLHWETSSRRAQMVKVINEETVSTSRAKTSGQLLYQTVDQLANLKAESQANNKSKNKTSQSTRRQLLGKYLLAIAHMAEAMDYEADEVLLRKKVDTTSPLHTRRTLDQYYFLTLDNTSERDRDQVVYRGTRSLSLTTRVVMVDQLWMWILDDNTIITSFPRRWGRNKPDPSGVHKSLRERLKNGTEVIKSVNHLAMIIMDQCSRVFFDKTRPLDDRPEVMDLFAAAIGTVAEKTRIAYDHFWRSIAVDPHYKGPLVINPEGIVLKEAQDIAEELMIMKRLYCEQLKVAKDFMRHLTQPRGSHAAISDDARLISRLLIDLVSQMRRDNEKTPDQNLPDFETLLDEDSVRESHEVHEFIEHLQSRLAEILDLEEAALRACSQLEGLLSLKQQQASIVDARAALDTAYESYKQGRTIQAFTIVTIVFLPLGFIAAFFGMNNHEINGADWMGLWEQMRWMFGGTAVVIFISISLAFGSWFRDLTSWIRVVLRFAFDVPWALFFQSTELSKFHEWWKGSLLNSKNLDRKRTAILAEIAKQKREKEERNAKKEQEKKEHGAQQVVKRVVTNVFPGSNNMESGAGVLDGDNRGFVDRITYRLRRRVNEDGTEWYYV